jgi:hypothetical protein
MSQRTLATLVLTGLLGACGGGGGDGSSESAPASERAAASTEGGEAAAPAEPSGPVVAALGVPVAEIGESHLREALADQGWDIRSVSSSGDNLNLVAFYDERRVHVGVNRPLHPMSRTRLEEDGAPIHAEGEDALYVQVGSPMDPMTDEESALARRILDALLGR